MTNRLINILILMNFSCLSWTSLGQNSSTKNNIQHLTHNQIGETIFDLKQKYEQQISQKDTLSALYTLNQLGQVYSQQAQYANASNYLWEALILADAIQDLNAIATIHEDIGWLYCFYLRKDEAFKYYNSTISIRKKLVRKKEISSKEMVSAYYNMVILHRELGEYENCKSYLDSCYQIMYASADKDLKVNNYILTEQALLNINTKKYEEGINQIHQVLPWFEEKAPSYLIVLFKELGDAYQIQKQYDLSINYYNKALHLSQTYENHKNYVPLIYDELTKVYTETGDCEKALSCLSKAKQTNEELFDSRSLNNKSLLELTDNFKNEKLIQKERAQNQKLKQLEHEANIRFYRNILLLGMIGFLLIFGFALLRFIKVKHRTEKELAQKKRDIERSKNLDIIDLKNKELTTNALQLVEKEKLLKELKSILFDSKKEVEKSELKKIFKKLTNNSNNYWKEFEMRLVEVNEDFYKVLKSNYPDLTPGELKMCAFVRLNYSSKEIANLLGIGVESVHSLRYRLRKKMGLERNDNLFEHLFSIEESKTE